MNITFEEYINIIENEILKKIKHQKINLNDKNEILNLNKDIAYIFSTFVIPVLSPFNLLIDYKKNNNKLVIDFIAEKVYQNKNQKIAKIIIEFKSIESKKTYKYKNIKLKLNSYYFLTFGNIDKIN